MGHLPPSYIECSLHHTQVLCIEYSYNQYEELCIGYTTYMRCINTDILC